MLSIEGFRPGVMERLGLGPEVCLGANPRLVYRAHDRMGTGGTARAGGRTRHQLSCPDRRAPSLGDADRPPPPPLNLVADLGGGALYLTVGILAAVLEARARPGAAKRWTSR